MPCGQKNRTSEIIHSQTVTPPFAAMDGTTFRLNTATTNSRTRSQRPKTRRKRGASFSAGVFGAVTSLGNRVLRQFACKRARGHISLVPGRTHTRGPAFVLAFAQPWGHVFKPPALPLHARFPLPHRTLP